MLELELSCRNINTDFFTCTYYGDDILYINIQEGGELSNIFLSKTDAEQLHSWLGRVVYSEDEGET